MSKKREDGIWPLEIDGVVPEIPKGFTRQILTLPTRSGNMRVEAFVIGPMAVYRSIDSFNPEMDWTLSHAGTGHSALKDYSFRICINKARKLSTLDWSALRFVDGELLGWSAELKRAVAERICDVRPGAAKDAAREPR